MLEPRVLMTGNTIGTAALLPFVDNPAGTGLRLASVNDHLNQTSDVNYWAFDALAGDTITIRVDSVGGTADTWVELRNSADGVLASNNNGGPNNDDMISTYAVPTSGRMYVRLGAYSGSGDYQLASTGARRDGAGVGYGLCERFDRGGVADAVEFVGDEPDGAHRGGGDGAAGVERRRGHVLHRVPEGGYAGQPGADAADDQHARRAGAAGGCGGERGRGYGRSATDGAFTGATAAAGAYYAPCRRTRGGGGRGVCAEFERVGQRVAGGGGDDPAGVGDDDERLLFQFDVTVDEE